ncbi:esterase/lipase family protein [Pantoea rwandensis]|uniref:GPI inositol-deacylase PGAP1-like alpha/beta domain-containing protein n=1 Tax=Pantoea rwandensis TaxID=1076550 RepID=A0ABM5RKL8_9GAMM|nr:alpha/beta hydrolase [Pantoea rwandensis]AIR86451.1 hypothetical protein LH22_13670 [Pantoea rwandensis]
MSEEKTTPKIEPTFDEDGNACYQLFSTPKEKNIVQQCVVYPDRVIPVIFIPGVMGSNLKSDDEDGLKIWRLDSNDQIAGDWFGTNAETRKKKLDPKKVVVDDGGKIDEKSELYLLKTRRERGWGTVGYTSYATFLNWLQNTLNDFNDGDSNERASLLQTTLKTEKGDVSLSKEEVDLTYRYLFPVFALGYNWLQSNSDSATALAKYIDKQIQFYRQYERQCEKVILITHSMGGLVARHYTQHLGGADRVLGVIHGVMPALGAAATYRRMKAGTENGSGNAKGWVAAQVLGGNAKAMTAVLSQSSGPLQLLPGKAYGQHWLKITDDKTTHAFPEEDPYSEIYLQRDKWWGLCEDQFINPSKSLNQAGLDRDWETFSKIIQREVKPFIEELSGKYHPQSWAFYSADKTYRSYGDVCWRANTPRVDAWLNRNRQRDVLAGRAVDKTEMLDKRSISSPLSGNGWAKGIHQTFQLLSAEEAGDGTVPVRSGCIAEHYLQARFQVSVEHESAFQNQLAQQFTLRALVKIVQNIKQTTLRDE